MIDIGANLTDTSFSKDLDLVLNRARDSGVTKIITTGTSVKASRRAVTLAKHSRGFLYATSGVHPHYADEVEADWINQLRLISNADVVVAIGETGLDYFRNFSERKTQKQVFQQQLELARELTMPVFVHDRDSKGDTYRLLREFKDVPSVVHCFTGSESELNQFVQLGCYIGITGWICDDRRGLELQQIARKIPIDRLLVETDSPYLLPRTIQPKPQSRRNEPSYLRFVLQKISETTGCDFDELQEATTANAKRLFRID